MATVVATSRGSSTSTASNDGAAKTTAPAATGSTTAPSKKKKTKRVITPMGKKKTFTSLDRRMSVEKDVVDELLLVCGVIGTTTTTENGKEELIPVTDCLNWLQDLQRALRRDEDLYRPISLLIGKWKVVEQKLLPLVMTCRYDTSIVLTVVKILVILTKPLADNTKRAGRMIIDTKKDQDLIQQQIKLRENALEQASLLMGYKRIVTHHSSHHDKQKSGTGLLSIFVSLLAEPLSRSGAARSDADHLTIELVLHLFRNLLSAEALLNTSSDTTRHSNQLHQEMISLFERELVLEILLVLGQEMELRENAQYNLLMMELLHHLFKSQDPAAVARSMLTTNVTSGPAGKATTAKNSGSSLLSSKLKLEKRQKRAMANSRHGHFGGTWLTEQRDGRRNYTSAIAAKGGHSQSRRGDTQMKRKNRKAEPFIGYAGKSLLAHTRRLSTEDGPSTARANQSLHTFCQRFVKDCYGPVMKSLKNEFRRDSVRLESSDKVVFFRIVWFFCQWRRLSTSSAEKQSSGLGQLIFTMDIFMFNLVLNATDSYQEHKQHGRLAQTVALYSEMMYLLQNMYDSKDNLDNVMSLGLLDTLFYANEPLDRLPKLLSKWTPGSTTREFVCDLVELCHSSLKLLDSNAKECKEYFKGKIVPKKSTDNIVKKKLAGLEFNVQHYFHRKIASNQVLSIYIHLLGQYSVNSAHVNHRIISMFLRISQTVLHPAEVAEPGAPVNPFASKRVTLEPMLYNIHVIMVMEQVLNDSAIREEKDFASLITFCTNIMHKFSKAAAVNPMLYLECLFKHNVPHRFCESVTNLYVSEELRMLYEREMLIEEQREYEAAGGQGDRRNPSRNSVDDDDDEDEEEQLEFDVEAVAQTKKSSTSEDDSSSDEAEKSDAEQEAPNSETAPEESTEPTTQPLGEIDDNTENDQSKVAETEETGDDSDDSVSDPSAKVAENKEMDIDSADESGTVRNKDPTLDLPSETGQTNEDDAEVEAEARLISQSKNSISDVDASDGSQPSSKEAAQNEDKELEEADDPVEKPAREEATTSSKRGNSETLEESPRKKSKTQDDDDSDNSIDFGGGGPTNATGASAFADSDED